MKKFFSIMLMLLPLTILATACDDDDDDMPNVGVQCTISGGVFEGNVIYVTPGSTLRIDGLTLINHTDKDAALGAVSYYWDHYLVGTNPTAPYELELDTSDMQPGIHLLQAQMPIYVVGYPICWGYIQYEVYIVTDESQIPGDGTETSKTVSGVIKERE